MGRAENARCDRPLALCRLQHPTGCQLRGHGFQRGELPAHQRQLREHEPQGVGRGVGGLFQGGGEGFAARGIAQLMGTSVRTVETHRLHLRRKLRIDGQAALVKYAVDYADLRGDPRPID
ncbi:hypothetical protein AVHM3334_07480 [Acidovorax sp. SUPP3334]|nr:hypothetical protein AVHM3334_07480 [Acidovorax sp. SUPP3334]